MWETATHPRGTFIPARAWLITSPETYKTLLRKHNVYLQSTTAIALEGIHVDRPSSGSPPRASNEQD
eukprot:3404604-Ditylum_brightwellii.AAC.1